MDITDRVVVITGASSGIGLATARIAADRGARLVLVARSENALRELVTETTDLLDENRHFEPFIAQWRAVVIGRNMFGPVRGPWPDEEWKGWWGDDPPFHCPVYVLTHYPRDPFELENGNSFHFVTEGLETAMAEAREAADDQDVSVGGGASTLQQAIAAGHLDEVVVHQVPILLGGGERLFDHLAGGAKVELVDVVEGADVLHLTYRFG